MLLGSFGGKGRPLTLALVRIRVLVVSASMGAGHDGAARELVRRLQAEGHDAEMRDFMKAAPARIGDLVRASYELQMRHAAWTYDLTYRLWYLLPFMCPPIGWFMCWLTGRRVLRWANDYDADVVVSTYPLASTVLGQLRRHGRLALPAVNFITDFGVHPLWVHPDIDLNMAVHPRPAFEAATKSGRPAIATGPMVSPGFSVPHDRAEARADLGLRDEDRAVLIVAGSWGVGAVAKTFRAIAAGGRFVPIAVCGRDERLRKRLSQIPGGRALGWRDDMPALMAASDALVENAGGLTSMEALQVGLPIISYKPIAGHGKENTAEMDEAGVSRVAHSTTELFELLDAVTQAGPTRRAMVDAGRDMFVSDPADHVVDLVRNGLSDVTMVGGVVHPAPVAVAAAVAGGRRPQRPSALVARVAAAVAAVPLLWAALTSGVGAVTAYGAGVAHPRGNVGPVAFIGVRLDGPELVDATIQQTLASLHATAVVDRTTALENPVAVQHLASLEVDVEGGGAGPRLDRRGHRVTMTPWDRAQLDVGANASLTQILGQPVKVFVPGRRLNAFDLVATYTSHSRPVVPDQTFQPADVDSSLHVVSHHVYLINGVGATSAQVEDLLQQLSTRLADAHLQGAPLVMLR